jgi:integrase
MKKRRNGEGTRRKKQGRDLIEARIPYKNEFGVRKYQSLYAKTDEELDEKVTAFKTGLNSGIGKTKPKFTLKEWSEIWLTDYLPANATLRETTKELYESITKTHVQKGPLAHVKLNEIDGTYIDHFILERGRTAGLSNSSRRTLHTVLNHLFKTATTKKFITHNPMRDSNRPPRIRTEAVWLTKSEVEAVLDELEHQKNRFLPLVEFIVLTGVRRGESLALTWKDIDFENSTLQIRATMTRTKNGYAPTPPKTANGTRPIKFNEGVKQLLTEVRRQQRVTRIAAGSKWVQTNYVFTSLVGTAIDGRTVHRNVKKALDSVLNKNATVHSLRHSAATLLLDGNFQHAHIISRTLGHGSIAITMDLYGHLDTEKQQEVMQALENSVRIRSGAKQLRQRRIS